MRLHAVLPAKEKYTKNQAGAVAMVVADFTQHSAYQGHTTIIGASISNKPLPAGNYQPIKSWHRFFSGRNKGLARGYIKWVKQLAPDRQPQLIEVHGRCAVAGMIARALPQIPVMLVLHNDPRDMDGARTIAERKALAKSLAGITAVSDYLISCFTDGLGTEVSLCPLHVSRFGLDKPFAQMPPKQKTITMVGRMVPEKGVLEAAQAAASILPQYPDWTFKVIGARRFEEGEITPYQKDVQNALAPLGGQAKMLGHLPLEEVRKHQAEAEIILAPSQWQEPAGRVVLEALCMGAALITSKKGGIPEYAGEDAILLETPDSEAIKAALTSLLSDDMLRKRWQQKAFDGYHADAQTAAAHMDAVRAKTMAYFAKSMNADKM